jgi:CelD/BcsL family acetyltransferase involved in cellulose biosynthesis
MSDDNRYSTEIIRDPTRFAALGPAWDALFERALRPHVNQSFEWASCVWETIMRPRGARLHVLVLREGARPVLIWPLVVLEYGRFLRAVQPLMMGSDDNDVLVEASPAAADLAEFAVRALRKSRGHDLVVTEWVRTNSMLDGALSAVPAVQTDVTRSVAWSGFADWAAYERGLSSRQSTDRRLRRLRECGHVAFELVEDPDRQRMLVAWLVRQKLDRLAVQEIAPLWQGEPMANFIIAASRRVTRFGKVLLFAMTLDDEPIAVQVAIQDAHGLLAFQIAHEPKFGKYGPGILIAQQFLQWAFERRLPVELGWGDSAFKKVFSNGEDKISTRIFPTSAWGKARMGIRAWQGQRQAAREARQAGKDHNGYERQ